MTIYRKYIEYLEYEYRWFNENIEYDLYEYDDDDYRCRNNVKKYTPSSMSEIKSCIPFSLHNAAYIKHCLLCCNISI